MKKRWKLMHKNMQEMTCVTSEPLFNALQQNLHTTAFYSKLPNFTLLFLQATESTIGACRAGLI